MAVRTLLLLVMLVLCAGPAKGRSFGIFDTISSAAAGNEEQGTGCKGIFIPGENQDSPLEGAKCNYGCICKALTAPGIPGMMPGMIPGMMPGMMPGQPVMQQGMPGNAFAAQGTMVSGNAVGGMSGLGSIIAKSGMAIYAASGALDPLFAMCLTMTSPGDAKPDILRAMEEIPEDDPSSSSSKYGSSSRSSKSSKSKTAETYGMLGPKNECLETCHRLALHIQANPANRQCRNFAALPAIKPGDPNGLPGIDYMIAKPQEDEGSSSNSRSRSSRSKSTSKRKFFRFQDQEFKILDA